MNEPETQPKSEATAQQPSEAAVVCSALLTAIRAKWDESKAISDRLRLQGTPSHNCNGLDYRLGVMDGISVARIEVEKLIAANCKGNYIPD